MTDRVEIADEWTIDQAQNLTERLRVKKSLTAN